MASSGKFAILHCFHKLITSKIVGEMVRRREEAKQNKTRLDEHKKKINEAFP